MAYQDVELDLGFATLTPIGGASRDLLSSGGSNIEKTNISHTTGWSNTETKEASVSITSSVAGSYGAASFSLSATVGFGYTTSTSLSESTTVSKDFYFRPGYITTYYQWGVSVKGQKILNGEIKLEAKSISELQNLKAAKETQATKVKITLKKIAPPAVFRIQAVDSRYYLHGDGIGNGNTRCIQTLDNDCQIMTAQKAGGDDESLYYIINKRTGYYMYADNGGRGNIHYKNGKSGDALWRLVPTGTADQFTLEAVNSDYYLHMDNGGKSNVRCFNRRDRGCQDLRFKAVRNSRY